MRYDDIDEDLVPETVQDEITNLLELDTDDLIKTVLAWGPFFWYWVGVCRQHYQSDRLERINEGRCLSVSAGCTQAGDAWTGTLMTTLWCMPDVFLDDVIRIHDAITMATRVH